MNSGLVIKNTGSWYQVEDGATHQRVMCRIRGKFRLRDIRTTNPVAVGDVVDYDDDGRGGYVITDIHERKNYIIRRSSNLSHQAHIIAANVDKAYIVATLDFPATNLEFVDRFLVTAEAYNVPAGIILNKIDLYGKEYRPQLESFRETYAGAGYEIVEVSAVRQINTDYLREAIQGKTTLFTGNSGVGKSTLINVIEPSLELRTGEISSYHNRGKHTTTFSEMFPLTGGGRLIDTPGIKGFGLVDFEEGEISRFFPEIFRHSPRCRYYNCTHTHEAECAVKEAVADGNIAESRYISYLKLLEKDNKHR